MHTILFSAAFVLAGSAFAQKPFLHEELNIFNPGFIERVPVAAHTVRKWDNDELPEPCFFEANRPFSDSNPAPHCEISDVDVWDATYADCPEPFTLCRCRSSPISEEALTFEFGRLPIGLRQQVGVFMTMPDDAPDAGWAYARGNTLVLFANSTDRVLNPTVILHESSHALDFNQVSPDTGKNYAFSQSQDHADAIAADTCWADNYAQRVGEDGNVVEPWAQNMVLRRVQVAEIDPVAEDCIQNQLRVVRQQADEKLSIEVCNLDKIKPFPTVPRNADKALRARALEKGAEVPVADCGLRVKA